MNLKDVIERLAQSGYSIRVEDQGGYDGYEIWVKRTEGVRITQHELDSLKKEGWIEPYGAGGYKLTDEGRKSYLRSTDEMGNGELVPPKAALAPEVPTP
jgi:hypothetical protein